MPARRVQGITVAISESSKPRHTRAWKRAGDLNERLARIGKGNPASLWSRDDVDLSIFLLYCTRILFSIFSFTRMYNIRIELFALDCRLARLAWM
jgi:hypothetical protein